MSDAPGAFHYRELFRSVIVARAVWAAAHLKIADALAQGPRTASDLAGELSLHAPSLERLLRVLSAQGYFVRDGTGRYALSDIGALLRSDHPQSQRAYVDSIWGGSHYEAFGCLAEAVRTAVNDAKRVLEEAAQRRGAVPLGRGARRVFGLSADLGGIVRHGPQTRRPAQHVGERRSLVAPRAAGTLGVIEHAPPCRRVGALVVHQHLRPQLGGREAGTVLSGAVHGQLDFLGKRRGRT